MYMQVHFRICILECKYSSFDKKILVKIIKWINQYYHNNKMIKKPIFSFACNEIKNAYFEYTL